MRTSVLIFGRSKCPNCETAKALAQQKGYVVTYRDVENEQIRSQMFSAVAKSGAAAPKSVPQIFVDGEYVGSLKEFELYAE